MLLQHQNYRRTPWKNGRGMTDDIAVDEGSAPRWRLSLATIERTAPFSDFPGYDRTFIVAGGAGVVLRPRGDSPLRSTGRARSTRFQENVPSSACRVGA